MTPTPPVTPIATASPLTTPSPTETSALLRQFNDFVKISNDDLVTVVLKHAELGQGITTGLTTIVAEELDASWEQMRWQFAPADTGRYANTILGVQATGGSSSIANSYQQLRQAAAGARAMLVEAAANLWDVNVAEIELADGVLSHPRSGKTARFGALAEAASKLEPPAEVKLKDPKDFKYIGKEVPRIDVPEKSDGSAVFTIDKTLDGMLVAAVLHPALFGATPKEVDDSEALKLDGVEKVVILPKGVGVLARDFWAALQGRQALKVTWDESKAEKRGSAELLADFKKLAQKPGTKSRDDGDVEVALKADSAKKIEAEFIFPYLAHAAMEPMGCVAQVTEDGCKLWDGAQIATLEQGNVAQALGIAVEKVFIEPVFAGGSFGRRGTPDSDFAVEAALLAKEAGGKPVKLTWTREDDMRGGRYRPMSYHRIAGAVDKDGKLSAYHHLVVIQSFFKGTPLEMMGVKNGVDATASEGSDTISYKIPNLRVEQHLTEAGVPVLWWRSVGHTHNAFVSETFLDELAELAGKDPIAVRRELLAEHPRLLGVLNAAVQAAGEPPQGERTGRGVAVHESFDSFVAQVVDVSVNDKGKIEVDKVYCAVDCGLVVNPDIVKAQMESGILYGMSAALYEEITLDKGKVKQGNFDTYRVARMPQTPEIEVVIVPSAEPPTGVGEPGLPPLAPALANAIYAATGKRIRELPMKKAGVV